MRQASNSVRLFTAVELPGDLRTALAAVPPAWKALFPAARWVPDRSMHVTLHFIGNVPQAEAMDIRRALAAAFPAQGAGAFDMRLLKPGYFARRGAAALWAGVSVQGRLLSLWRTLGGVLSAVTSVETGRTYRPHVTLARVPDAAKGDLEAWAEDNAAPAWAGKTFPVTSFALVKSDLTPSGPIYRIVGRYGLGE